MVKIQTAKNYSACKHTSRSLRRLCLNLHSQEADVNSQVEIKIWHRPTSKKKKKRNLVAHATHSFAELLKRQDPSEFLSPVSMTNIHSKSRNSSASKTHLSISHKARWHCESWQTSKWSSFAPQGPPTKFGYSWRAGRQYARGNMFGR